MKLIEVPRLIERDFLPEEEHSALLRWAIENEGRYQPARVNAGGVNPAMRRSLSLRDLGPIAKVLCDRVASCVPRWIETLRVTPFSNDRIELELVAHNDGAHFARHTDTYVGSEARLQHRILSGVYYLYREPKGFSGGALRLHPFGAAGKEIGFTDIAPDQNSLVVFPS